MTPLTKLGSNLIFAYFQKGNGSVGVFYQPTEVGPHSLDVRNNGEHVQGSPFKFYASPNDVGKVYAYGPGLSHGVCGDSSNFVISTKGMKIWLSKSGTTPLPTRYVLIIFKRFQMRYCSCMYQLI